MLCVVRPSRRLLAVLTTLLLVVGALGSVKAAWMCEGRVCSPDLARCCCASSPELRDGECVAEFSGGANDSCAGRCGCQAVATGIASATSVATSAPAVVAQELPPVVALPSAILAFQAFVLLEAPGVRPLPPPDGARPCVCIERASLRAPPAAAS